MRLYLLTGFVIAACLCMVRGVLSIVNQMQACGGDCDMLPEFWFQLFVYALFCASIIHQLRSQR